MGDPLNPNPIMPLPASDTTYLPSANSHRSQRQTAAHLGHFMLPRTATINGSSHPRHISVPREFTIITLFAAVMFSIEQIFVKKPHSTFTLMDSLLLDEIVFDFLFWRVEAA